MALTDMAIRASKPRVKSFKLTDSAGLHLLITPTGGKFWRFSYRFAGKQKTLALGAYPIVTLAEARNGRDIARKHLAVGVDPSIKRKLDKQSAANTFRVVAEELLKKFEREGRAPTTLGKLRWLLDFVFAAFGERPIAEITAPEILLVLRRIEARGKYETARRLRSTCGMVFRYAIATARADRDPSADLRGALTAPKVTHRAAIIEPNAIGGLLRAIDEYDGCRVIRLALQLAPLVFVRPGELRCAEWQEFDFDAAEWRIPTDKMKMRRPHRVPLSRQALTILQQLRPIVPWRQHPIVQSDAREEIPAVENSCHLLHRKFIVHVLHSGRRDNILAATPCLRGCKFLFVTPQSSDSRMEFARKPGENFIESRIIGWKKEWTTQIDTSCIGTCAEPSNDVADIYGEKANHLRRLLEILCNLIHCPICNQE
jgi:integrase